MSDLHPYTPTPGPWRVAEGNPTLVFDNKHEEVAHCGNRYLERPQQCLANTRLIAAAPDLLASLRELLAGAPYGSEAAVYQRARAAVLKAEGAE
ncbi:MAG: hypothetical protein OXF51_01825 [Alphaproteobacteria bacterium]|nr:hypothetical protein [Alphaproteobacteria bacterium]